MNSNAPSLKYTAALLIAIAIVVILFEVSLPAAPEKSDVSRCLALKDLSHLCWNSLEDKG